MFISWDLMACNEILLRAVQKKKKTPQLPKLGDLSVASLMIRLYLQCAGGKTVFS